MSPLPRWLSNRPPSAALEITARRVTLAVVTNQGGRVLSGYANEPLPEGAVEPALNAVNVHDPAALTAAVRAALENAGPHPRRIALVLPDIVGKLSLVRFEKIPAKMQDLDQLIRWQVRKAAPFKIEDAQIAWVPGMALPEGGREYVVVVARRDIVESYERACEAAGVYPGIVDLASINLINASLVTQASAPGGDWLLVHVAPEYSTLAVVRGGDVVFFRTRPSEQDENLADLVHQTAMYHEDRLGGGGFARVWLSGGGAATDVARAEVSARLNVSVGTFDIASAAGVRDRGGPTDLADTLAAPVGILIRERAA